MLPLSTRVSLFSYTPAEHRLFNELMLSPKARKWDLMAKEFKARADGVNIFCKLPAQLKKRCGQWEKNSRIKAFASRLRAPYTALVRQLGAPQPIAPPNSEIPVPPKPANVGEVNEQGLRQFVPPISAPQQKAPVKVATTARGKCHFPFNLQRNFGN